MAAASMSGRATNRKVVRVSFLAHPICDINGIRSISLLCWKLLALWLHQPMINLLLAMEANMLKIAIYPLLQFQRVLPRGLGRGSTGSIDVVGYIWHFIAKCSCAVTVVISFILYRTFAELSRSWPPYWTLVFAVDVTARRAALWAS